MDFSITDEQQLLLANLAELVQRECPESYVAQCDREKAMPIKGLKALADAGFMGMGYPEELGGTPCDAVTLAMIIETIARHADSLALYYQATVLVGYDIMEFGTEEQKREVLPKIIAGEAIAPAIGITEPGAGSDDAGMVTTYRFEGDDVIFTGQKTWCTGAHFAKWILLLTRDLENPNPPQGRQYVAHSD